MPNVNKNYVSYLLQFRSIPRDNRRIWIASVRSTATDELRQFPNLDALIQFIRDEFDNGEETKALSQPATQVTETKSNVEPRS